MKKEGILLLIVLLILSLNLVASQEDAKVKKGYECLENKVKDKCDSLSVEEKAFTVLASGKCDSELIASSQDETCWPSSSCTVKETALSVLALRRINKDTDKAEDWLVNQTDVPNDLIWFLEIDADKESICKITYDGQEKEITLKSDKTLSGSAGRCLSIDAGGYWLRIDGGCYGLNFTVSCDEEFITTLLYKKRNGATVYVSSKTNKASSQGYTEEEVNARCFGKGCDYEGSLWATYALALTGHDVSSYIPYIIAMGEDNEKYFPSAFLYMITDYDDFLSQLIKLQTNNYWRIADSPYGQFYDTALALLSMQKLSSDQASAAKAYLLEVQEADGCWGSSIRDTAFILYAGWPKDISSVIPGGGDEDYCEDYSSYTCVSVGDCSYEDKIDLPCKTGAGLCCKKAAESKTCSEKNGIECTELQECTSNYMESSDSSRCCAGSCKDKVVTTEPECELEENYTCRSECLDSEESSILACNNNDVCCKPKEEKKKSSYWWIYVLIILIALVALGLVFKDRIRAFIFKLQKKQEGPGQSPQIGSPVRRFPPFNQQMPPQRIMPRPPLNRPPLGSAPSRPSSPIGGPSLARPSPAPAAGPSPKPPQKPIQKPTQKTSSKDKELEETLRKLKEMSK